MKKILVLFLICSCSILTKANENPCQALIRLKREANLLGKSNKFRDAINKLNSAQVAARDCNPAKEMEVREKIRELFENIEKLRVEAEEAKNKAVASEKKAKIATNNARATYWYSEGSKYAPTQKLRLWLKAIAIPHLGTGIQKSLEDGIIETVKQSDSHQWHEKKRFSNVKAFISDDSKWIVTIDENAKAEVWDIEKGISKNYLKKEKIHKISFSPNSQWLVTTDTTNDIHIHKIWNMNTETLCHKFYYTFKDSDMSLSKYFSKDDKWFELRLDKNISEVWDLLNKKSYSFNQALPLSITDVSFSVDSRWIAVITSKGAKLWDIKKNEWVIEFLKDERVSEISFSPNSQWLITKDKSDKANVWSLKDFQKPSFLRNETFYAPYFSPKDKWLITRDAPNDKCTSKIWDMSNGEIILKDTLPDVEFSPNNNWLVNKQKLANDYYQLKVWDITQKSWKNFLQNEKDIYRYSFSPNSLWLETKHKSFSKIWDLKKGQQIHKFSNTSDSLKSIVKIEISNDCHWVLIIDKYDRAKIWNTQKEKWYDFLQGERDISIAKFFANNELLLTKDDFGIVKIWNLSFKDNDANEAKKAFEKIENANDIKKIQEWINAFGDQYLLPLDEEIKQKYGIKD